MKIYRKPSLKKAFRARTTAKWKRQAKKKVNPFYGKKGMGKYRNTKKYLYNKGYNRATKAVYSNKQVSRKGNNKNSSGIIEAYAIVFFLCVLGLVLESHSNKKEKMEVNSTSEIVSTEEKLNPTEEKQFTSKEDFPVNKFLIEYCKIAQYPLAQNRIEELNETKNEIVGYEGVFKNNINFYIDGKSHTGHDFVLKVYAALNNDEVIKIVFNDCIKAIYSDVSTEELEELWERLITTKKNVDFRGELKCSYNVSDGTDDNWYEIFIVYK